MKSTSLWSDTLTSEYPVHPGLWGDGRHRRYPHTVSTVDKFGPSARRTDPLEDLPSWNSWRHIILRRENPLQAPLQGN